MHPIENILKSTMSELKEMVDVNTIVGTPFVSPDGCTIIPISKLSFGLVSGGAQYGEAAKREDGEGYPFGGGSATGVSISPVAFMVADDKALKLLTVSHRNVVDKLVENIPQMICELKSLFGQEKQTCGCEEKE